MDRHGQLDHAKPRTQMPAGHRHGIDHLRPQFVGQLRQFVLAQRAQIRRIANLVQQGSAGSITQMPPARNAIGSNGTWLGAAGPVIAVIEGFFRPFAAKVQTNVAFLWIVSPSGANDSPHQATGFIYAFRFFRFRQNRNYSKRPAFLVEKGASKGLPPAHPASCAGVRSPYPHGSRCCGASAIRPVRLAG